GGGRGEGGGGGGGGEKGGGGRGRRVEGQGRAVPGRADPPQGREGWEVVMAGTKIRSHARATGRVRPHTHATAAGRVRRHLRVRKKVTGSASRPRLVVNRSARPLFAQI